MIVSIVSFLIGGFYRITLERSIKKKSYSNKLERLEALESAYYLLGAIFLLVGVAFLGLHLK